MNILICGLKGTGKTTLSKRLSASLKLSYISDFEICNGKDISSSAIAEFLNSHDNFVVDSCYGISPEECKKISNAICVFLGFASASESRLMAAFSQHGGQITAAQIKKIKMQSKNMKAECQKFDIPFFDIADDRERILEKIFEQIVTKMADT